MPLNLIQKNDMIKTQKERKQNMANINEEHREMEQEKTQKEEQGVQEVLPVNTKAKDTFFKTVYASEERRRELAYIQRAGRKEKQSGYVMPCNVTNVADYLELLIKRGIFVDLLTDQEVCNMTMAQFYHRRSISV